MEKYTNSPPLSLQKVSEASSGVLKLELNSHNVCKILARASSLLFSVSNLAIRRSHRGMCGDNLHPHPTAACWWWHAKTQTRQYYLVIIFVGEDGASNDVHRWNKAKAKLEESKQLSCTCVMSSW